MILLCCVTCIGYDAYLLVRFGRGRSRACFGLNLLVIACLFIYCLLVFVLFPMLCVCGVH